VAGMAIVQGPDDNITVAARLVVDAIASANAETSTVVATEASQDGHIGIPFLVGLSSFGATPSVVSIESVRDIDALKELATETPAPEPVTEAPAVAENAVSNVVATEEPVPHTAEVTQATQSASSSTHTTEGRDAGTAAEASAAEPPANATDGFGATGATPTVVSVESVGDRPGEAGRLPPVTEIAARLTNEAAVAAKARARSLSESQVSVASRNIVDAASPASIHSTAAQEASGPSSLAQEVATDLLGRLLEAQPAREVAAVVEDDTAEAEVFVAQAAEEVQTAQIAARLASEAAAAAKAKVRSGTDPQVRSQMSPVSGSPADVTSPASDHSTAALHEISVSDRSSLAQEVTSDLLDRLLRTDAPPPQQQSARQAQVPAVTPAPPSQEVQATEVELPVQISSPISAISEPAQAVEVAAAQAAEEAQVAQEIAQLAREAAAAADAIEARSIVDSQVSHGEVSPPSSLAQEASGPSSLAQEVAADMLIRALPHEAPPQAAPLAPQTVAVEVPQVPTPQRQAATTPAQVPAQPAAAHDHTEAVATPRGEEVREEEIRVANEIARLAGEVAAAASEAEAQSVADSQAVSQASYGGFHLSEAPSPVSNPSSLAQEVAADMLDRVFLQDVASASPVSAVPAPTLQAEAKATAAPKKETAAKSPAKPPRPPQAPQPPASQAAGPSPLPARQERLPSNVPSLITPRDDAVSCSLGAEVTEAALESVAQQLLSDATQKGLVQQGVDNAVQAAAEGADISPTGSIEGSIEHASEGGLTDAQQLAAAAVAAAAAPSTAAAAEVSQDDAVAIPSFASFAGIGATPTVVSVDSARERAATAEGIQPASQPATGQQRAPTDVASLVTPIDDGGSCSLGAEVTEGALDSIARQLLTDVAGKADQAASLTTAPVGNDGAAEGLVQQELANALEAAARGATVSPTGSLEGSVVVQGSDGGSMTDAEQLAAAAVRAAAAPSSVGAVELLQDSREDPVTIPPLASFAQMGGTPTVVSIGSVQPQAPGSSLPSGGSFSAGAQATEVAIESVAQQLITDVTRQVDRAANVATGPMELEAETQDFVEEQVNNALQAAARGAVVTPTASIEGSVVMQGSVDGSLTDAERLAAAAFVRAAATSTAGAVDVSQDGAAAIPPLVISPQVAPSPTVVSGASAADRSGMALGIEVEQGAVEAAHQTAEQDRTPSATSAPGDPRELDAAIAAKELVTEITNDKELLPTPAQVPAHSATGSVEGAATAQGSDGGVNVQMAERLANAAFAAIHPPPSSAMETHISQDGAVLPPIVSFGAGGVPLTPTVVSIESMGAGYGALGAEMTQAAVQSAQQRPPEAAEPTVVRKPHEVQRVPSHSTAPIASEGGQVVLETELAQVLQAGARSTPGSVEGSIVQQGSDGSMAGAEQLVATAVAAATTPTSFPAVAEAAAPPVAPQLPPDGHKQEARAPSQAAESVGPEEGFVRAELNNVLQAATVKAESSATGSVAGSPVVQGSVGSLTVAEQLTAAAVAAAAVPQPSAPASEVLHTSEVGDLNDAAAAAHVEAAPSTAVMETVISQGASAIPAFVTPELGAPASSVLEPAATGEEPATATAEGQSSGPAAPSPSAAAPVQHVPASVASAGGQDQAVLESAAQQMLTDVAKKAERAVSHATGSMGSEVVPEGFAQEEMDTVLQAAASRAQSFATGSVAGSPIVHGSAGSLTVAEQLTAAAVTAAHEHPRPAPEPPSASPEALQAEQVADSVVAAAARQVERTPSTVVMETEISQAASPLPPLVTAEVLAATSSVVEVVATDEEPEAQVPAAKPVVEEAPGHQKPPDDPAALAAPSSEVGPASVHASSAAASGTAGLDIVPRSEQGQAIASTPAYEATDVASASVVPETATSDLPAQQLLPRPSQDAGDHEEVVSASHSEVHEGRLGETVVHDILHSVAEKEEPATAVASSPREVQVPSEWITPEAPAVSAPGSAALQPGETVTPAPVASTSPVPSEHISHAGQAPAIGGPGSAAEEHHGVTALETAPAAAPTPVPSDVVPEAPSAPGSEHGPTAPSAAGSGHPAVPSIPGSEHPVPSAPASEHPAPSAPGSEPQVPVASDELPQEPAQPQDAVEAPAVIPEPVEELPPSEQGRRPPQVPRLWEDTRLEMPAVGASASASDFSGLSPPRTSLWSPGTGYETDGSGYPDEGSMAEYSYEDPGRTMRMPQAEGSFPHDRSTQKISAWGAPASRSEAQYSDSVVSSRSDSARYDRPTESSAAMPSLVDPNIISELCRLLKAPDTPPSERGNFRRPPQVPKLWGQETQPAPKASPAPEPMPAATMIAAAVPAPAGLSHRTTPRSSGRGPLFGPGSQRSGPSEEAPYSAANETMVVKPNVVLSPDDRATQKWSGRAAPAPVYAESATSSRSGVSQDPGSPSQPSLVDPKLIAELCRLLNAPETPPSDRDHLRRPLPRSWHEEPASARPPQVSKQLPATGKAPSEALSGPSQPNTARTSVRSRCSDSEAEGGKGDLIEEREALEEEVCSIMDVLRGLYPVS